MSQSTKEPKLTINGIEVTKESLMAFFLMVFAPNPDNWYRFERVIDGDNFQLMVETRPVERLVN